MSNILSNIGQEISVPTYSFWNELSVSKLSDRPSRVGFVHNLVLYNLIRMYLVKIISDGHKSNMEHPSQYQVVYPYKIHESC